MTKKMEELKELIDDAVKNNGGKLELTNIQIEYFAVQLDCLARKNILNRVK